MKTVERQRQCGIHVTLTTTNNHKLIWCLLFHFNFFFYSVGNNAILLLFPVAHHCHCVRWLGKFFAMSLPPQPRPTFARAKSFHTHSRRCSFGAFAMERGEDTSEKIKIKNNRTHLDGRSREWTTGFKHIWLNRQWLSCGKMHVPLKYTMYNVQVHVHIHILWLRVYFILYAFFFIIFISNFLPGMPMQSSCSSSNSRTLRGLRIRNIC